ncbi:hypothetical protein RN01_28095 [Cupriavidus sp. SHE]|jgi:hypothetical protein|uniref:hypothetical protein n=1 Tax=Cupriavidus TaxID=106589 RepID=UPI000464DC15|nr:MULTISPECIES: hypothetical protein [Cupriavidus]KWR76464.1 hypothetical protein RN01_28095 [Cupriavidus sp. SHE]
MENIQFQVLSDTVKYLLGKVNELEKQNHALRTGFNLLSARSDLAELSIQDLYESHWTREKLAEKARQNAAQLLDARAEHPNPEYEQYLTLTLAALLEAAGEPPQR